MKSKEKMKKIQDRETARGENQKQRGKLKLLIHHCIKILDQYSTCIEDHPKDIQPEVLHIYVSCRTLFNYGLPKSKASYLKGFLDRLIEKLHLFNSWSSTHPQSVC
jgi:CRISPR/Cas system-associated protein Csx1